MEVNRILGVAVVRREVHAPAEPPDVTFALARVRDEHPDVQVHGGRVGIARVQHQRYAHRLPRAPGDFRA
jgi:hypothetical protein